MFSLFLVFSPKPFASPAPSSLWPSRLSRGRPHLPAPKLPPPQPLLAFHAAVACPPPPRTRMKMKQSATQPPSASPMNRHYIVSPLSSKRLTSKRTHRPPPHPFANIKRSLTSPIFTSPYLMSPFTKPRLAAIEVICRPVDLAVPPLSIAFSEDPLSPLFLPINSR
jgi:hypothetical protein